MIAFSRKVIIDLHTVMNVFQLTESVTAKPHHSFTLSTFRREFSFVMH